MKQTERDPVSEALIRTLISPNRLDSNLEPANLVDVLGQVADGLHKLADAISGPWSRAVVLGRSLVQDLEDK